MGAPVAVAPFALALFAAARAADPAPAARAPAAAQVRPYLPRVSVQTQDGAEVRFYEDLLRGKLVVINFMFTSCKARCPVTTRKLAEVQRQLRDLPEVRFISITVDPAVDTPERLRAFAAEFHALPGWSFVTGTPAAIDTLRTRFGVREKLPMDHTGILLLGDEPRGRWAAIPSLSRTAQIVEALRELAKGRDRPHG